MTAWLARAVEVAGRFDAGHGIAMPARNQLDRLFERFHYLPATALVCHANEDPPKTQNWREKVRSSPCFSRGLGMNAEPFI